MFDKRKVENNSLDYRLTIDNSNPGYFCWKKADSPNKTTGFSDLQTGYKIYINLFIDLRFHIVYKIQFIQA